MSTAVNASVVSAFGDMLADAFAKPMVRSTGSGKSRPRGAGNNKPLIQMLMPMQLWDWPEPNTGMMSYQQQALADAVPTSLAASAPFSPSGTSFSNSYVNFLSLIDKPSFALSSRLDTILAMCKEPQDGPGMTVPDGWAKAPDGVGLTRMRLAYGVSLTLRDWTTQKGLGQSQPLFLRLPVSSETSLTVTDGAGVARTVPLQGKTSEVIISAKTCGRVNVLPGAWFDGSLLDFAKDGPFVKGLAAGSAYDSMLSGRVASIIVADNPTFTLVLPASEVADTGKLLETAKAIEIGGFRFESSATIPAAAPGGPDEAKEYVALANSGPWIIAAVLETFS
jgi:hypothetical protein